MTATEPMTALDAVIVGAGFSGLYMLHKLRNEMGLTARVIEAGGGVGGTWWWNRYPGARSDSDSYIYGFMFDEELWKEWRWTERYPEQHEVRAYLEHVAQRYDLLRDIVFNIRAIVVKASHKCGCNADRNRGCDSIECHVVVVPPCSSGKTSDFGMSAADLLSSSLVSAELPGGDISARLLRCATVIGCQRPGSSLAP